MGGGIGIPPMLGVSKAIKGDKHIFLGYRDCNNFLADEFLPHGNVYIATEDGSVGCKGNVMNALAALAVAMRYGISPERAAEGLSKELLYMKFLQGLPVVGAVGGIYDAVYMKRITEYANLKYKKRFLMKKMER